MTRLVRAYLAERVRAVVFVPALAALGLAAWWASGPELTRLRALPFLLLVALLVQFRLWDDLEDVDHDRRVHPTRVLVQSPAAPFRRLLAVLAVTSLTLAAMAGPAVLMGVAAIDGLFLLAYRLVRRRVSDRFWRYGVLLAKYPAFVLLGALAAGLDAPPDRLGLAMAVAMTGACLYEALHQRRADAGAQP